jgi:hypothetical protein
MQDFPEYRTIRKKFPDGSIARQFEDGRVQKLLHKEGNNSRMREPIQNYRGPMGTSVKSNNDEKKSKVEFKDFTQTAKVSTEDGKEWNRESKISRMVQMKLEKEKLPTHFESLSTYVTSINNIKRILNSVEGKKIYNLTFKTLKFSSFNF